MLALAGNSYNLPENPELYYPWGFILRGSRLSQRPGEVKRQGPTTKRSSTMKPAQTSKHSWPVDRERQGNPYGVSVNGC
eukprot:9149015-Pyramimonas_sp.AAC.1